MRWGGIAVRGRKENKELKSYIGDRDNGKSLVDYDKDGELIVHDGEGEKEIKTGRIEDGRVRMMTK